MACMYHATFQRSRNYLTSLPDGALNVLKYANPPPNSQMKPAEEMTTALELYAFAAFAYWLSVNPFKGVTTGTGPTDQLITGATHREKVGLF